MLISFKKSVLTVSSGIFNELLNWFKKLSSNAADSIDALATMFLGTSLMIRSIIEDVIDTSSRIEVDFDFDFVDPRETLRLISDTLLDTFEKELDLTDLFEVVGMDLLFGGIVLFLGNGF
eukprot:NODE_235_length_13458_cov_0.279737.p11 type:complete len:120 gc:universal NODE_235_length_13458_cov_0.279737:2980-2621(-)